MPLPPIAGTYPRAIKPSHDPEPPISQTDPMPSPPRAPLNVLALDPWLGGSHQAFLENLRRCSANNFEIKGLPARHWKWRMRGGAWQLARQLAQDPVPERLLVSDYLDLPAFFGFMPPNWGHVPCMLYFHENQLTYPNLESPGPPDTSYGFINVLSVLRADWVVFNSEFHRTEFCEAGSRLLRKLPRPTPLREFEEAMEQAAVAAPGVHVQAIPLGAGNGNGPLRVLFPHRWEHDKDPRLFLQTMLELAAVQPHFELILLGEQYSNLPPGVSSCLEQLRPYIVHEGFMPDHGQYLEQLGSCDLVVSTAQHEFFGIAVVEAMAAGVQPLLPDRLSYPEVLGPHLAAEALYDSTEDLRQRLAAWVADPAPLRQAQRRRSLRQRATDWSVEASAGVIDQLLNSPAR